MRNFRGGLLAAACACTMAVVGGFVAVRGEGPVPASPGATTRATGPATEVVDIGDQLRGAAARGQQTLTRAARERARALRAEARRIAGVQARRSAPISLRIGSMNVLGSQHTGEHTRLAARAPGRLRAQWEATVITRQRADIVGFGELQRDQLFVLMALLPGFDFYPKTSLQGGTPTNIMWRTDRFELVDAHTLTINFLGQQRPLPIVHLRDRATGRTFYVFNAHNSPNRGGKHSYTKQRNKQVRQEIAEINRLRQTGDSVFFLGDLNSHDPVFCKVTAGTDLTAAAGGSNSGRCRPPRPIRADWIFGSDTTWSDFVFDRSRLVRRSTDHSVPFATATLS